MIPHNVQRQPTVLMNESTVMMWYNMVYNFVGIPSVYGRHGVVRLQVVSRREGARRYFREH